MSNSLYGVKMRWAKQMNSLCLGIQFTSSLIATLHLLCPALCLGDRQHLHYFAQCIPIRLGQWETAEEKREWSGERVKYIGFSLLKVITTETPWQVLILTLQSFCLSILCTRTLNLCYYPQESTVSPRSRAVASQPLPWAPEFTDARACISLFSL